MTALALQSSTTQVDKLGEHDSVDSGITARQWILLKETGKKGGVDPENKKHGAAFFCEFLYHASNPVRVPHLQRILHQSKRNKQNIPCCGFSESEVMNQNQLKGNQICSGKQRSLWLWEHCQRWPQRDQTISFPSGIPFWNCLEPRYLRTTANCSGVQLLLRWPKAFESQNLNKHLYLFQVPYYALKVSQDTVAQDRCQQVALRGPRTKHHYQRSCKGGTLAHQLGNSS